MGLMMFKVKIFKGYYESLCKDDFLGEKSLERVLEKILGVAYYGFEEEYFHNCVVKSHLDLPEEEVKEVELDDDTFMYYLLVEIKEAAIKYNNSLLNAPDELFINVAIMAYGRFLAMACDYNKKD